MRVLGIVFLIFLLLITIINIIANKINKDYVFLNKKLGDQNELFKKSILFIRTQLNLTRLKDCPDEEKENIVKEVIDFVNEIEKVW